MPWYKGKMKELRQKHNEGLCQICGDEGQEFAHKKGSPKRLNGIGRGLPQRYRDVLNHPEDYLLLCYVCHLTYDGKAPRTKA